MIRFVIFLFSICMFSQGYETQKYEVVKALGDIELRFYPPAMKAKVSAGGNFSRLFKYISGNNEQGEKISMTTPVQMTSKNNKTVMEFILPSKYNENNFAVPKDKNITVYSSNPGLYAAITFGGYSNSEKVKKYYSILLEKIKENNFFSKENEYSYIFVFAFDSNDRVIERKVLNLSELQKNKMSKIETENNIIQRGLIEKIFGGVGTQKAPITD